MGKCVRRLIPLLLIAAFVVASASPILANDQPEDVLIYLSTPSSGRVDGFDFKDEDIVAYNTETDTWAIHFDGSDLGLTGHDLDAVHVLSDNDDATLDPILVSLRNGRSFPGFFADDSDIVEFTPAALGTNTAGSFSLYLDGSSAGLTGSGENVDTVALAPDGRLIVGTVGSFQVPAAGGGTLVGAKQDLIVREASGDWSLYFDGSDVALTASKEDLTGVWVGDDSIHLTTKGSFSVADLKGDKDDVFTFAGTLGTTTSGAFSAYWDGDLHRFDNVALNGLSIASLNAPPDIEPQSFAVEENSPNGTSVGTIVATDPDGDTPTYEVVGGTGDTAFDVDSVSGEITVADSTQLDLETTPSFSLDVQAGDGNGGTDHATMTIDLIGVDEPPSITSNGGGDTAEVDVEENTTAVTDVDATDPEGETESGGGLVYSLSGPDSALFSIDVAGILSFVSAPDFEAPTDVGLDNTYDVTVTVEDSTFLTDAQDIAVTVNDVNEPPVVTSSGAMNTFTVNGPPVVIDGTITVSDVDSADLASATVTLTNRPDGDAFESLMADVGGTAIAASYDPATGQLSLTGVDTIANYQQVLQTADYANGDNPVDETDRIVEFVVNDGFLDSNAAQATVEVNNNQQPVAQDDGFSMDEDDVLNGNVLADNGNGVDSDPDFDLLTVNTTPVSGPTSGGLTLLANGDLTYTPNANFNGTDTFEYEIDDGNGATDIGEVTVEVMAVNDPPVVVAPGSFGVIGNVSISVPDGGDDLLANASDPADGLGALPLVVGGTVPTGTANGGDLSINTTTGAFTYDPAPGIEGSDSFDYQVCDNGVPGTACSPPATVTLEVSGMIWFVDSGASAGGDGRLSAPFNDLTGTGSFDAVAADEADDAIFLADGSYAGGLTLLGSQTLIGDGSSSDLATILGISPVPPHSTGLPAFSGTDPQITGASGGISLGSGNTVRGLDIGTTGGTALGGGSVGALEVLEVDTISASGGKALDLAGGSAAMSVDVGTVTATGSSVGGISLNGNPGSSTTIGGVAITTTGSTGLFANNAGTVNVLGSANTISSAAGFAVSATNTTIGAGNWTFSSISSSSAANGILLDNTGSTGTFTVTGDGSQARNQSGGTISGTTGDGVSLNNAHGVTLQSMAVLTPGAVGVDSNDSSGITLSGVNIESTTGDGYRGLDLRGANRIDNDSLIRNPVNSGTHGISIQNSDNATKGMSLTLNNSTFQDTTSSNGATFVEFSWRSLGGLLATDTAMTLNVENGSTFQNLFGSAIVVGAGDAAGADGIVDVNVVDSFFINANTGGSGGTNNLEIKASEDVKATFAIDNNLFDSVGLPLATAGVVQVQANDEAIMDGSITNNTISNVGTSPSLSYVGVQILSDNSSNAQTPGPHQLTMTNNDITGTANAGVRMLIFDNTTDFDLTFTDNTVGTIASPVGTNVQEAVEIRVGDLAAGITGPSRMDALIDNNDIVNSGSDQPMDIDAEDNGDISATVTNNVFRNVGTATQSFAATSESAGTTFCLDLRSNEAYFGTGTTPGEYRVTESAGVFTANQTTNAALAAAQTNGSALINGTIGAVTSCPQP